VGVCIYNIYIYIYIYWVGLRIDAALIMVRLPLCVILWLHHALTVARNFLTWSHLYTHLAACHLIAPCLTLTHPDCHRLPLPALCHCLHPATDTHTP
jgi:hypothetical protein